MFWYIMWPRDHMSYHNIVVIIIQPFLPLLWIYPWVDIHKISSNKTEKRQKFLDLNHRHEGCGRWNNTYCMGHKRVNTGQSRWDLEAIGFLCYIASSTNVKDLDPSYLCHRRRIPPLSWKIQNLSFYNNNKNLIYFVQTLKQVTILVTKKTPFNP